MLSRGSVFVMTILFLNISVDPSLTVELENGLEGYNEGDEECYLTAHTERIQIGIAADITGSNINNVKRTFASRAKEIVDAVNSIHNETEFAITVHANWEQGAFRAHRDPEGCYTRKLNFTTDVAKIAEVASTLDEKTGPTYPQGGDDENGLSGVTFTTTDSTIGWIREDIDKAGRRVHRFILLFTDQYSIFKLNKPGNRTAFRGDGSDTCSTSLPPTEDMIGQILKRDKMYVIGVYVHMDAYDYQKYIGFFQKYEIPHVSQRFRDTSHLRREIVEFIRDSVKRQLQCVFDDPLAYNTLGL